MSKINLRIRCILCLKNHQNVQFNRVYAYTLLPHEVIGYAIEPQQTPFLISSLFSSILTSHASNTHTHALQLFAMCNVHVQCALYNVQLHVNHVSMLLLLCRNTVIKLTSDFSYSSWIKTSRFNFNRVHKV